MKILYIITGLRHGGAEKLLYSTCKQLRKDLNAEIEIIYFDPYAPLQPLFAQIGIPTLLMKRNIWLLPKLARFMRKGNFDIIHTHLIHADFFGRLVAYLVTSKRQSAIFATAHGIERFRRQKTIYCALVRQIDRLLALPERSYVVAISKSVSAILSQNQHIPEHKIHLLYNALEVPAAQSLVPGQQTGAGLRLLFVGRLVPEKNIPCLLRAMALDKDPRITLTIVGEGEMADDLKNLAASLGVSKRVAFPGATSDPDLYYASHDVLVLPSHSEGLGIVILEAFCRGLAVIGSDVDGIRELLGNGRGLLFPDNDDVQLAAQIKTLCNDPELRIRLGQEGFSHAKEHHDIRDYVRKLYELYERANAACSGNYERK